MPLDNYTLWVHGKKIATVAAVDEKDAMKQIQASKRFTDMRELRTGRSDAPLEWSFEITYMGDT